MNNKLFIIPCRVIGKSFSLAVLLLLMSTSLKAQLSAYNFQSSSGTYSAISGGTLLGNTTSDDQAFVDPAIPLGGVVQTGVGFPIGFEFVFDGQTFDRFGINANGWIFLGQSALTPSVNVAANSYSP